MTQQTKQIPVSSIILDEDIYPRKGIDHRRVGIFAENIRDGFAFDPIEVAPCPDKPGFYRLLDGAHRWSAYKSMGVGECKSQLFGYWKGHREIKTDSGLISERSSSCKPDRS